MNPRLRANIFLVIATTFFGANYVIAKGLMPDYLLPRQIIFIRVLLSMLIFIIAHRIWIKEKILYPDIFRLAMCGALGIAINQILYYEGLNLTTPINASIIHTSSPVMVILISVALGKENINVFKIAGIVAGLTGALILILYGDSVRDARHGDSSDILTGNILVFLNL